MVSIADVAPEAVQENHSPKPKLSGTAIGNTLGAICHPTAGSRA